MKKKEWLEVAASEFRRYGQSVEDADAKALDLFRYYADDDGDQAALARDPILLVGRAVRGD